MEPHCPIVCTLTSAELAERRATVLHRLRHEFREVKPVADGFTFRLDPTDEALAAVHQFIVLERQCCRFMHFQLTVEPDGGPLWLTVSGPEGTGSFMESELGLA